MPVDWQELDGGDGDSGPGTAGLETLQPGQLLTGTLPPGLLVQMGWDGLGFHYEEPLAELQAPWLSLHNSL